MNFERSTEANWEVELEIHNSNPFFNRISNGKEMLTAEEIRENIRSGAGVGGERYLIRDGDRSVGILEFLMKNPSDGCTWLGLFVISQEVQLQGYGARALRKFEKLMVSRNVTSYRIGVLADNAPAHAFWTKQGFERHEGFKSIDGKKAVIYEKRIGSKGAAE